MSTLLKRQRAREIVCDAFNSFTDLKLEPTEEGDNANIQNTLKSLDVKFIHLIHDNIVGDVVKMGCESSLGVGGFVVARYGSIGDVVDDLISSTKCP
jgi:hypothetical protein